MEVKLQPVLIDGSWRAAIDPVGSFYAYDPSTKTRLEERYPISHRQDIEAAAEAAYQAVIALRSIDTNEIAVFLDLYAAKIESRADELVKMAHLETALPAETRLRGNELPRTTNQLRQAAATVRDGSWRRATIDTKNNIRSILAPLAGPAVVFGPNNFPFAFNSISGGDFASAIAAGNPVIAKANPAHPGTTRLLAEAAFEALQESKLPRAMVQLLYHLEPEDGFALVGHPLIGATAFTGSRNGGLRLKEAADKAGKPIYLEMSSINPVFILPGALGERSDAISGEFTASMLAGTGQFCTNPGVVVLLENSAGRDFMNKTADKVQSSPVGILFGENSPRHLEASVSVLVENGARVLIGGQEGSSNGYCYLNTLMEVPGSTFLQHSEALQTEAFGPASLFVLAKDESELVQIADHFHGNLTGTIYSHTQGDDDALYNKVAAVLRSKVGRLINDKMPTGVLVSPAMNHGGPYPSTGHPGFTAVGIPAALLRFVALHSYDTVRQHRLPRELQDKNPTGSMWRYIDNEWTQRDI